MMDPPPAMKPLGGGSFLYRVVSFASGPHYAGDPGTVDHPLAPVTGPVRDVQHRSLTGLVVRVDDRVLLRVQRYTASLSSVVGLPRFDCVLTRPALTAATAVHEHPGQLTLVDRWGTRSSRGVVTAPRAGTLQTALYATWSPVVASADHTVVLDQNSAHTSACAIRTGSDSTGDSDEVIVPFWSTDHGPGSHDISGWSHAYTTRLQYLRAQPVSLELSTPYA